MADSKPQRAAKKKSGVLKKALFGLLVLALVLSLAGVGAFLYLYQSSEIPDANADFQTNTTFIYYSDGEKLGSLSVQNRETLDYEDIPEVMKQAAVAAENRSFWTDPGISIPGMARAAYTIARGGEIQGGSTITQQYIKILYLDSERTMERKIRELFLAMRMDNDMSKEEILAGYLNTIYFGRGAYGVEAASKSYFLKPSAELTVPEAASLAAILNNPSGFNPSGTDENRERLLGRYRYVLDGMLEMEYITQAEHDEYVQQLPEFPEVPETNRYGGPTGYLMNMVEREMAELGFDEAQVQGGGLRITTTIDKRLNDHAISVVNEATETAAATARDGASADDLHIALASVDTATGGILALYGGKDYVEEPINWATTPRPAASTYKMFALIAGLRQGFSLNDTFRGNSFVPQGESQLVNNQGRQQYGNAITLRRATEVSSNTAFVDLTEKMDDGVASVVKAATDAGAPDIGWKPHQRVAMGFNEVSPLNIANSYATVANEGMRNQAHIVAQVTDMDGNVLYDAAEREGTQTIERDVALGTIDALKSVVENGTGRDAAELGYPVAGKTGTNGADEGINAAWFEGTTKQISTAVMYVAGDEGTSDLTPYRQPGTNTFFGSGFPLDTWLAYMQVAMEGMEEQDWDEPSGTQTRRTTQREDDSENDRPRETRPTETAEPEETEPEPTQTAESQESEPEPTQTPTTQDPAPTTQAPQPTQAPEPTEGPGTTPPTTQPTRAPQPTQPPVEPDPPTEE